LKDVLDFDLGQDLFTTAHHNKMVSVAGKIGSANPVTPELLIAQFKCNHCGTIIEQSQGGGKCKLLYPEACPNAKCRSIELGLKFTFLQEKSEFSNYQEIWLRPEDKPKINLGKGQKIILKQKLVGAKEGEKIQITGKLGFELKGKTNFAIPIVIALKVKRLK